MINRSKTQISSRKQPKQSRSSELVAAILEAATRVLAKGGAQHFTTARVAEAAGVSVGSLYQYFPNKASILFRLQSDEWRRTSEMLRHILEDHKQLPLARLRSLVHSFLRSECEEAGLRVALNDAAPLYRHAPETQAAMVETNHAVQRFMLDVLPGSEEATRQRVGELIITTLTEVGEKFSEIPRGQAEITAYADNMADMFCTYLKALQGAAGG